MDFRAIDKSRQAAGISQYRLCRRADVHPTTYHRLRKKPAVAQPRTLKRLSKALSELLQERAPA